MTGDDRSATGSGPLPYSAWCYVCGRDNPHGLKLVFRTDGTRVVVDYTADAARQGYPGRVHGGILSALLDEAMGWAPTMKTGLMCVTAELSVRFLKPAPAGVALRVTAWCEDWTRRIHRTEGDVRVVETGLVVARATGKYAPLGPEATAEVDSLLIYDPETLRVLLPGNR